MGQNVGVPYGHVRCIIYGAAFVNKQYLRAFMGYPVFIGQQGRQVAVAEQIEQVRHRVSGGIVGLAALEAVKGGGAYVAAGAVLKNQHGPRFRLQFKGL